MAVLAILAGLGFVHISFAMYGKNKGWSPTICWGGGFIVTCIAFIIISLPFTASDNISDGIVNLLKLLVFCAVLFGCVKLSLNIKAKKQEQLMEKVNDLLKQHSTSLSVRRQQLITTDHYGVVNDKKWQDEISHFIEKVIVPVSGTLGYGTTIELYKIVDQAAASIPSDIRFSNNMSPTEYEQLVCQTLKEHEWEARTTKGSGDQGIDVVASLNGKRIVIQCKLYSNNVGNSAVQEAVAGREFEKAQFAAVVSNAAFTASAKQLAATANVLLLHHDELPYLYARL
jgi:restriction system protein